eukprot:SAG31_NODE_19024_length_614_cov_0.916505_2_plen_85_part_00
MAGGWGVTLSLGASNRDGPDGATNRTIATVAEWNEVVDGFDVAGTVAQLIEVKACWVFLAVRRTTSKNHKNNCLRCPVKNCWRR